MGEPLEDDTSTWTYMPWLQEYVMQNRRLTKEHYKMVFLANRIQHLLNTVQEAASRKVLVDEFMPVAKRHLRYEILVMNVIDYKNIDTDSYVRHCLSHDDLEEGIDDICSRISDIDMSEVVDFLRNWLDNHIKKEDAAYNAEIFKLGLSDDA